MLATIEKDDMLLDLIERKICKDIKGKELWGDIRFTQDEYEKLREIVARKLNNAKFSILEFADEYPLSLTTLMVFMVRYKYDTNFWGLMEEELSVPINANHQSEIGTRVKIVFGNYGFDFSESQDDPRTNLAPIFYEAGIPPETCIDDLFFILYNDRNRLFDPLLVIEDLLETRSYQIRKPLERFLRRFKDNRAIDFVVDVYDSILCVEQNMPELSPYIQRYKNWKENQTDKEVSSSRKNTTYQQAKPYLCFDREKGISMVLPKVILQDEWTEIVAWKITNERDESIKKEMNVQGDEGSRFVGSITVPVYPSEKYTITLLESESLEGKNIISWLLKGIALDNAVFFDSNGRQVNAKYILSPYMTMVIGQKAKMVENSNISVEIELFPTDREEYQTKTVVPEANDAYMRLIRGGTDCVLRSKPDLDVTLTGKTLFSIPAARSFLIFTEIPNLKIKVNQETDVSELELRVAGERIALASLFENGELDTTLSNITCVRFTQYGTYSIRIYQSDNLMKQIEFSYVPEVQSTYFYHMAWPSTQKINENRTFVFQKSDAYNLEFPGCFVRSDEQCYRVECSPKVGAINMKMESAIADNDFRVPTVSLPVNPFVCSILDSTGTIQANDSKTGILKVGLGDIAEKTYWLSVEAFGEYRNDSFTLQLHTGNGIEQTAPFTMSHSGCKNMNLKVFYDTLSSCMLPARIELCCCRFADKAVPLLTVTDNVGLKRRPQYKNGKLILSIEDKEKDVTIRRFGQGKVECQLQYCSARINSKGNGIVYTCPSQLPDGIYTVECYKTDRIFEFEDDTDPIPTNGFQTIYVTSYPKAETVISFSDWLAAYVQVILKSGTRNNVPDTDDFCKLPTLSELNNRAVTRTDAELLVALAYFVEDTRCSSAKITFMKQIMLEISRTILTANDRCLLIQTLSALDCPQSIFENCLAYYNLYLFGCGSYSTELAKSLAEQIENKSPTLALLLHMSCFDTIRNTLLRDRFKELIGTEALRSLLTAPQTNSNIEVKEEIRRFVNDRPGCKIKVELSKELSGDMQPIIDMIVYPKVSTQAAYLDTTKKPNSGIYFDHIKYIDQYINWHKLNYDSSENLYNEIEQKMISTVRENAKCIMDGIKAIKKDLNVEQIASRFDKSLKARYNKDPIANTNVAIPHRFFYLQALAALIVMLPVEYRRPSWFVEAAEHFMTDALSIAPQIAKRDLLMAGTFVYLVRKEAILCQ